MAFQTYPLSPLPAYYVNMRPELTDGGLCRNNLYYDDEDVIFTFASGPDAYEVYDWYGTLVDSGAVSGTTLNLGSAWDCGWYRVRLTGASTDALFGDAYGASMFTVARDLGLLPRRPATTYNIYNFKPNGYGRTDAEVDAGSGNGGLPDMILRSMFGVGCSRNEWTRPLTESPWGHVDDVPPYGGIEDLQQWITNAANPYWLDPDVADPVRERNPWLAFADVQTWDWLIFTPQGINQWLVLLPRNVTTLNGNNLFASLTAGTTSGYKVTIYYPDVSTVVETYDNLADGVAAVTAIRSVSDYVWPVGGSTITPDLVPTPQVVGGNRADTISEIVAALYPYGFHHYEGPYNEWGSGESGAWMMKLFQEAVHAGHPDAKAIGPCFVDIVNFRDASNGTWRRFLDNGGADYCDELAFHDYNTVVNGDINEGRANIENFFAELEAVGVDTATKKMWQTEATHAKISDLFAVAHFRRARFVTIKTMLWEQYGIPMEKNPYWYDLSHGFWGYSSFLAAGGPGQAVLPQGILLRTLTEETFGKLYHHRVDFGSVSANRIFLGNVYGDASVGSVMALVATSPLDTNTVTLQIVGTTDALTVSDAFGNVTSAAQTAGRVTVTVGDVPTYVRLPVGVNAWVYAVNDWGASPAPNVGPTGYVTTLGGQSRPTIADGLMMTAYTGTTTSPGVTHSASVLPDEAIIKFPQDMSVERVVIWNGPCWQSMPGMLDFDVDTLDADGVTWTTRKTVTRTASSDWFGDGWVLGTQRETFWNEQWIEDVKLPTPVTTKGIRVSVRDASYGGEPDANMITFLGADLSANGMPVPMLAIQDIAVISPTAYVLPETYVDEVTADSPILWLRLGEASGTVAVSETNSPTLDGTYVNNPSLGIEGTVGDGNTAFGNDSTQSGYVLVPHNALLNVGDTFTLECWYRPTASFYGQYRAIMGKGSTTWALGTNTDGKVYLVKTNTGIIVNTSVTALSVNEWSHIVVTKTGATTKIYINAEDVTGTGTDVTFANNFLDFSALSSSNNDMDEVAVYGTVLSAARVLAHYQAGTAPTLPVNSSVPTVYA